MSYVSNHVHIVFSTTNRMKLIREDVQPKLWAYMAGIVTNHGMHAVAIGGSEDHVHALVNLGPTLGVAKAVQILKANSSRWMGSIRIRDLNGKRDTSPLASADPKSQPLGGTLRPSGNTTAG